MRRLLISLGVITLVGLLLWRLSQALAPVFTALFIAYLADPFVSKCQKKMSRTIASILAVVLLLLGVVAVLFLVVPLLVRQLTLLAERVPDYVVRAQTFLVPWLQERFGVEIPVTFEDLSSVITENARSLAESLVGPLGEILGGLMGSLRGLILGIINAVLVPFFFFFFVRDFPRMVNFVRSLVPAQHTERVTTISSEIDQSVAAWLRGQLTVMLIQGTLYAAGLTLVGLDFGILIGFLAGILAFIPYAGVAVGMIMALMISLVDFHGWGQVVGVLAVFGAVQTLDAVLITPRVVGERTGLGPLGVLIGLMVFGELFGFVGVLLAVPLAASGVVLVKHLLTAYRGNQPLPKQEPPGSDGRSP